MTDVAPTEKHTLTSAVRAAEEAEESGDYYVGSFFEDDPETPSQPAYICVTYDFGGGWITAPPLKARRKSFSRSATPQIMESLSCWSSGASTENLGCPLGLTSLRSSASAA